MKRFLSIAAVTVALVSLSSCKKDYTCECTSNSTGTVLSTLQIPDSKKSDAQSSCDAWEAQYAILGLTCELK
jgi:hypothetical protein